MRLIIIRMRYNESARRSMRNDAGMSRVRIFQSLCDELGFKMVDGGRSTLGDAVYVVRGPAEKVGLLQRTMDHSGGYDEMTAEFIDPWEDVGATAREASRLGQRFIPPDQDEIDRLLLDE